MPFPAGAKKPRITETIRSVGCSLHRSRSYLLARPGVRPSERAFSRSCGDAGTITERVGNPQDTDPWEWRRGFLSGGTIRAARHPLLRKPRADFEGACWGRRKLARDQ